MRSPTSASETTWQLYLDWCRATGHKPGDTRLREFFSQIPAAPATQRARERAIHDRLGIERPAREYQQPSGPGPSWRSGQGWGDLGQALAHTPTAGWPSGLRGRRDAFLLVIVSLGLTRQEATALTPDSATVNPPVCNTILGREAPYQADPRTCPRCAVTRWLNILGLYRKWGVGVSRAQLIRQAQSAPVHACLNPITNSEWQLSPTLLPGIDKHGWVEEHQPISTRTVSAIIARRLAEPVINPEPAMIGHSVSVRRSKRDRTCVSSQARENLDRLAELLDAVEDQTEAFETLIRTVENDAKVLGKRAAEND